MPALSFVVSVIEPNLQNKSKTLLIFFSSFFASGLSWTPFLEREDILVWRQEHPQGSGLYAYKMYGKFDDVTANEFLEVQLDMSEFRWARNIKQKYFISEFPFYVVS